MNPVVRIGVLRLTDSAPVIVAADRGIFTGLGLEVLVQIEPSWANIADKLSYGLLDVAVMLPPLALAAAMGLRGPASKLVVPMSLSQGGNTIVLSTEAASGVASSGTLPVWLHVQTVPPRFAVVHPFSTHNVLLRYWLASSGVDPDRDIETVVIPPEDVVAALAAGRIAGFCAGAPWGDVAASCGAGEVVIGTSAIWPHHPEKCLALAEGWAEANPEAMHLVLRALLRAQILCDRPTESTAIAALLAREDGLHLPAAETLAALPGGTATERIRFSAGTTWFPAQAHAMWFLGQMQRWGWIEAAVSLPEIARRVYRSDLLAPALLAEGILSPLALPALEGEMIVPHDGGSAHD